MTRANELIEAVLSGNDPASLISEAPNKVFRPPSGWRIKSTPEQEVWSYSLPSYLNLEVVASTSSVDEFRAGKDTPFILNVLERPGRSKKYVERRFLTLNKGNAASKLDKITQELKDKYYIK